MSATLEIMSRKANTVEIDPEQFRADYRVLSQNDLMRKYGITSTTLMKMIRQHVPPNERYSVRMRNGLAAVGMSAANATN